MATKDITDLQVCLAVVAADAIRAAGGRRPHLDDVLAAWTGEHPKVCLRALERAYGRRLIECGIGIYASWLEPAGRELIAAQRVGPSDFHVGDLVTRAGDDVQLVTYVGEAGDTGSFLCVVAPESGWCGQWDTENNLLRRYDRWAPPAIDNQATVEKSFRQLEVSAIKTEAP